MGFVLNVAPSIMQTIVDTILMKDEYIQRAVSAYIDDIYVDESVMPTAREGISRQLWTREQRTGEAKEWCASAWSTGLGGASHTLLEKKEQDPGYALHHHLTQHIFIMRQAGWTSSCRWMALCGLGLHQAESI